MLIRRPLYKVSIIYSLLVVLLASGGHGVIGQNAWKVAKSKNGIKVFVSPVKGSSYFAYKAETILTATPSEIKEVLLNVEGYPLWFAYTASTRLIKSSGNKQLFFMETDYPWPYSNECMHYLMEFKQAKGNFEKIDITGIVGKDDCDYSLKKANGYILLEANGDATKVTYYFHCEPSQSIPPWLINPRIHEMPFQTLVGLRKELLK